MLRTPASRHAVGAAGVEIGGDQQVIVLAPIRVAHHDHPDWSLVDAILRTSRVKPPTLRTSPTGQPRIIRREMSHDNVNVLSVGG